MKFIAYYRVSSKKQEYGIDAQREAVTRYLSSVSGEVIASFQERETGTNNARPQLALAIQSAKVNGAILVIAKLDRLSRNASFLMQLQDSHLDFVCCDVPNADRFTISILACVAQRERELISERTKAGLAVAKAKGIVLGNRNAPIAWQKAMVSIRERKKRFAESAIKSIREIQSTGISSLNRLSDCLNKRGERTARGGRWTATAVKRVMITVGT